MTRGPRPCTLQFIHYNRIIYITAALIWHHHSCIPCSNSLPFPPVLFIIFHCLLSWLVARGHTWRIGCSFFERFFFFLEDRDKIHSTPRCSLTVPACAVCFQMNSWENMVAFWPAYIPAPPLTAATAILPSRSIISILSFTLFLFLFFWLALWTKHGARWHCKACLLPSQVLSVCSSVPLRAP